MSKGTKKQTTLSALTQVAISLVEVTRDSMDFDDASRNLIPNMNILHSYLEVIQDLVEVEYGLIEESEA